MKVTIDPDSGFCFGVNRAIEVATKELAAGKTVYCLGEMVHNQVQMEKLKSMGLKVITHANLPGLRGQKVIVRAHGEPPETFRIAIEHGITLIDATCPIVTKLQQRIHESFIAEKTKDTQLVIFGKPGHAEVAGLVGNAGNTAIVVSNEMDISKIDLLRPVRLFSQTTMDSESYLKIGEIIKLRMLEAGNHDMVINRSVCRQVSGRAPALRTFANNHDVVIFVTGNNSANGAYLFGICKTANSKSYCVSSVQEVDNNWFEGAASVGVSGATSTPGWLIADIAEYIGSIS